jgi:hypothetical protein
MVQSVEPGGRRAWIAGQEVRRAIGPAVFNGADEADGVRKRLKRVTLAEAGHVTTTLRPGPGGVVTACID